jgi:hypothetical protein
MEFLRFKEKVRFLFNFFFRQDHGIKDKSRFTGSGFAQGYAATGEKKDIGG